MTEFQIFTLELYHWSGSSSSSSDLVRNVTLAGNPVFAVARLDPAAVFEARIYASNRKVKNYLPQ